MTETLQKIPSRTVLTGVRWETYQALVFDLAENPGKRLTFDRGILEIMTPRSEHEINKRFLGRIVEATTEIMGLEIASLGSTTWSCEELQKGIEPDECFYITHETLIRGKLVFDLSIDPAPDLAIEIDITSGSLDRLGIYAALGVGEVWRFDGEDLFIYTLQKGVYEERENSRVLPILSRSILLGFLQQRGEKGENELFREFRQRLRERR